MKKTVLLLLALIVLASLAGCGGNSAMPVVLLTDFGVNDYRTPVLKGYIYSASPDVTVIDGTHGISPLDIAGGAYVLDMTAKEFPGNVVFVAIVGTLPSPEHEYIIVETNKGQIFLAPDNGLLTYVIENQGIKNAYKITDEKLYEGIIKTQASHDICGKVGALIASGYDMKKAGPSLADPVMLDIQQPNYADGKLEGAVVYIDGYGNCLTNISLTDYLQVNKVAYQPLRVTAGGNTVTMIGGNSYGDVAIGEPVAFMNVRGVLELAINWGNFAAAHGVSAGAKVIIEPYEYNDAELLLRELEQAVQQELDRLDDNMAAAASQLSGLDPAGAQARAILRGLVDEHSYIADCATVSRDGKLVAIEPASFNSHEGEDISTQEQVIRLFITGEPVLSDIFYAVEGFYAVDLEHPVFSPGGELSGSVSALFKPDALFARIAGPKQQPALSAWAMQTDGLMLYDADPEEIGRNTFLDPMYQSFPQILELAKEIIAAKSGTGSYEFYDTGLKTVVEKEAYWTTVGLHGTGWRLVISRTVS